MSGIRGVRLVRSARAGFVAVAVVGAAITVTAMPSNALPASAPRAIAVTTATTTSPTHPGRIPAGGGSLTGRPAPSSTPSPAMFTSERPRAGSTSQIPGHKDELVWSSGCDADLTTPEPFCTEPTGYYQVSGTVSHARRELVADLEDDPPHPKAPLYADTDVDYVGNVPAREVLVRVADGCGLYTDTYTDAAGAYSVVFPSWCGDKAATVTLYSISTPGAGRQVALALHTAEPPPNSYVDLDDDPSLYTVISGEVGTFVPEDGAEVPEDCADGSCEGGIVLDRTFWNYENGRLYELGQMSRQGEVAIALTVMENTMTALDYYRQLVDDDRLPQINLVLTDETLDKEYNTAVYRPSQSTMIYIPPRMEWSAWAVVHETSHYFDGGILVEGGIDNYGRWGEAVANVRAGLVLGTSWMSAAEDLPSENLDVQGAWDDGAGEIVTENLPESGPTQGWLWRIFWDLSDAGPTTPEPLDFGSGEFDQWDGGGSSPSPFDHLFNGVLIEYLPQTTGQVHPDYLDRGQAGPDLVDMLDGFACLYGMSHLQMETLLHEVMGYQYDFAHCADPGDVSPTPAG